jgi:4-hydroxy-tetrahydrodipicolinate synthase
MAFEVLRQRLAGVVAITVTPFTARDTVDDAALSAVTARMTKAGIGALTPNGNTGEYYSLDAAERRRCLSVVAEASGEAVVVAGVGGALADAISEAKQARDAGAAAVMVHQPVHPYITTHGWLEYNRRIADAVPELGLVPYVKTQRVTAEALTRLAESAPSVVGLKYALPDPVGFATIRADTDAPGVVWIAGLAESYAASQFAATAQGFTSGLANVVPEVSLDYFEALRSGDYAGAYARWQQIRDFEDLRARDDNALNVSVVKEALHQLGLCNRAVRPPISVLDAQDRERVGRMLREWQSATPAAVAG